MESALWLVRSDAGAASHGRPQNHRLDSLADREGFEPSNGY